MYFKTPLKLLLEKCALYMIIYVKITLYFSYEGAISPHGYIIESRLVGEKPAEHVGIKYTSGAIEALLQRITPVIV